MNIHIKDKKESKEKKGNPAAADEKKSGSPAKQEDASAKTSPQKEDKKTEAPEQLKDLKEKNEELKKSEADLKNKLDETEQKLKAVSGQYVRLQADFDNYRKRNAKLAMTAEDNTKATVLKDFLPVIDNFDIALTHMKKENQGAAFVKGFELLQKQLKKIMKDYGVSEIEAEGKEFDPHYHEAVMQVQNDKLKDDSVAMVLQKGYKYKETVLRPAKVQVVHNN